jgi:hypothetical protein
MANIVSVTARFSGTVAFTDNTVSIFHSGMEGTETDYILWSVDQAESIETLKQVSWSGPGLWPWWALVRIALSSFNFMDFDWDTPLPTTQKVVSSLTGRCDFIFAFDDNTTATASVATPSDINLAHIDASMIVTVEDESIATADNIALVRLGIQTLLSNVMEDAWVTA